MKRILSTILLLLFILCSTSYGAIIYQYDCDDNATAPTVGTNLAITTANANVNGVDTQLSTLITEKITIPTAEADINNIDLTLELRLEYPMSDPSGGLRFRPFAGKFSSAVGVNGDWMLSSQGDDSAISLFIVGSISNLQWSGAAITAAHNDGAFHTWRLSTDNVNPVNGSSHVALYLDDVLQTVTATDRTTPWTALYNANDVYILSASYNSGIYYSPSSYVDYIIIHDTVVVPPTITVTDDDQLINPYNSAEEFIFTLSGVYTVDTPVSVEYQAFRDDNDAIIQIGGNDWNTLLSATIGGGTYTGITAGVPKTDSFIRFRVRYSDQTDITAEQTAVTSVGFISAWIGQSPIWNFFNIGTGTPGALVRMHPTNGTTGRAWTTLTGAGAIAVANQLSTSLGCPVGLMAHGKNSAALEEKNEIAGNGWWYTDVTPSTEYTALITATDAIGGAVNNVFWYGMESDAIGDVSTSQVAEADFINNQLRVDVDYSGTGILPVMLSLLATWDDTNTTDLKWSTVNQGKLDNFDAGVFDKICTPINMTKIDAYHVDTFEYAPIVARAIEVQEGVETTYRSPRATSALAINTETIDVTIEFDIGTDFTPTSGIDIFDVNIGTVGVPNWISSTGVRQDATTVRLTHATGTAVEIRVLYGRLPDLTNDILDNSAFTLSIIQEMGIPVTTSTENPAMLMMLFRQSYTPAVASSIFSSDTFDGEVGDVLLTAHTGEVDATWLVTTGDTAQTVRTTGFIDNDAASPTGCYSSGVPDDADYIVQADIIKISSGTVSLGIAGRVSTSAKTMYGAWYSGSSGEWVLFTWIAGSYNELGTYAQALTLSQAYDLKLVMTGTTISLEVDDVERISVTNSDITAVGRAGVTGVSANAAIHLDNFVATN